MESISPVNIALSPELIQPSYSVPHVRHNTMAPIEPVVNDDEQGFEQYDFSNYNPDVDEFADPVQVAGQGVVQNSANLGDAMVQALENGFTVQDACNIKLAQIAYKASCSAFKAAVSTFDIGV